MFFSLELPRVLRPPFPNIEPVPAIVPADADDPEDDEGTESFPLFPSSFEEAPLDVPDEVFAETEVFCFFFFVSSSFSSTCSCGAEAVADNGRFSATGAL